MVLATSAPGVAPAAAPASGRLVALEELAFTNSFQAELPADPEPRSFIRQVSGAAYSRVLPTPADGEPRLVCASRECAELLGLDPSELSRPEFALVFGGSAVLPGMDPYAQCYGGHQFGTWAGQLGDGRAITLAEVSPEGRASQEVQLKGAGQTPYSRRADGRAVLRSSLREFICSEAMHHLGVPTTRALCLVATGAPVVRDMFYMGDPKVEPGAVTTRVAPSFVRFGTFQLPVSRGDKALARRVAGYVIRRHFPQHWDGKAEMDAESESEPKGYDVEGWLREVAERTGRLVAKWQLVRQEQWLVLKWMGRWQVAWWHGRGCK